MKILTIFTGGTISCINTDGVLSPNKKSNRLLINLFFEKYKKYINKIIFDCFEPYTILSENLSAKNLKTLYELITSKNLDEYDGIIVVHGTDTIQYTSAFLSYTLDLKIPLLVVSANYPLSDEKSNGLANFYGAVKFIENNFAKGVFVSYTNSKENTKYHRGTSVLSQLSFDDKIFSVSNCYFAELVNDKIIINSNYSQQPHLVIPFDYETFSKNDVIAFSISPFIVYPKLDKNIKAILMTSYHSGTLCTASKEFIEFCKSASKLNIPIFLTGAEKGFYYESKEMYDTLKINVLPKESPISQIIKLKLIKHNLPKSMYMPF